MDKQDKQELRVAIGADGKAFAPSWKIWVHGDSVYPVARSLGQAKVSLHPETWRIAMTAESAAVLPGTGRRLMYDWEPPGEHMPGHMLATTIGTPRLGEEVEVPSFVERDTRRVEWIASPPLLAGVWFQVWLSERDEPPATGGKARRPPFRLPDGRFVWITVTERELTVGEVRDLTATRENVKVPMTGKQRPGKPPRGTFATIWDIRDKAESPFITQLFPTPRNFVYEG